MGVDINEGWECVGGGGGWRGDLYLSGRGVCVSVCMCVCM